LRYYMKDGDAAYQMMRTMSLGITNDDLAKIPMNKAQIVHDTTFDDVAYIQLRGNTIVAQKHAHQILPPASMSKLMTALVFLESGVLDWNRKITITEAVIDYPKQMVGSDPTSEIAFEVGDTVTLYDLWVAMLVASSNQAAAAIAESTGMTLTEFVVAMNEKAKSMGLEKTAFFDPSGLDSHNVTTPYEMAKIAQAAFNRAEIYNASRQKKYTISTISPTPREIVVYDRNYSLWNFGADAAKTGFLDEAQRCVSLKKDEDIFVIMHARSMKERNEILENLL